MHCKLLYFLVCLPIPDFFLLDKCNRNLFSETPCRYSLLKEYFLQNLITIFGFSGWCIFVCISLSQVCLILVQAHCFSEYIKNYNKVAKNIVDYVNNPNTKLLTEVFQEIQLMVASQHRQINCSYVYVGILVSSACLQIMAKYVVIDFIRRRSQV